MNKSLRSHVVLLTDYYPNLRSATLRPDVTCIISLHKRMMIFNYYTV